MKRQLYWLYKIIEKLIGDDEQKLLHKYFKMQGVKIGENCKVYSNIITSESYLLTIGDNVTISGEVLFLTHDNSICKCIKNTTDLFGRIDIGANCFIGARSILMYGVTLADNIIVGAGSVVTHSFHEEGIIIAGSPAKKIGSVEEFARKMGKKAWNLNLMTQTEKNDTLCKSSKLVER